MMMIIMIMIMMTLKSMLMMLVMKMIMNEQSVPVREISNLPLHAIYHLDASAYGGFGDFGILGLPL